MATRIKQQCNSYLERAECLKIWVQESTPHQSGVLFAEHTLESNRNTSLFERFLVSDQICFNDIAGMDDIKERLKEYVVLPILFPSLFKGHIRRWNHIVCIYGPQGVGKTSLAKSLNGEINNHSKAKVRVYHVSCKMLLENYKATYNIREVFEIFEEYKKREGIVLIIDDIEDLVGETTEHRAPHNEIFTELMLRLTDVRDNARAVSSVIVLIRSPWTNRNKPVLRRCGWRLLAKLPDFKARLQLLKTNLNGKSFELSADDYCELSLLTHRLNGAEIKSAATSMDALSPEDLNWEKIREIFKNYEPSISAEEVDRYEDYALETSPVDSYKPRELQPSGEVQCLQTRCCDVVIDMLPIGPSLEPCDIIKIKLPLPRTLCLLVTQRTMQRMGRW